MFHDDVCDGNGGIDLNDYHPVMEHIRLETPFDFNGTPMYDWCLLDRGRVL